MTTPSSSVTLLRALGSGVVPTERPPSGSDPRSLDFAAMLDKARAGEVRSGLTVTVDPALELTLDPEQVELLSQVADAAEAQGLDRVLVLSGGDKLVLDVARRRITEQVGGDSGTLLTGFDAVVQLPEPHAPGDPVAANVETERAVAGGRLLRLLGSIGSSPDS